MISKRKFFSWFLALLFFLVFLKGYSLAINEQECEERLGHLSSEEARDCELLWDKLYQETSVQKRTLQVEINRFGMAIKITANKIFQTANEIGELEDQIKNLSTKIGRLDLSLDQVSALLIKRITETYKQGQIDYLALFLSSSDFSEFIARFKYLKIIQLNDRKLMLQMEIVKTNYEDQRNIKEEKQTELEAAQKKFQAQKNLLAQQKGDQEKLLAVTQNNELRYQKFLEATRAEIEAIQNIIAGRGEETEAGEVGQGAVIASIISGASACSTGTHLHFEVREGETVKNPFDFLKNIDLTDDSGGDPYGGRGDWDWPLNQPVKFNQGFGSDTSAIRSRIVWYNFHTGIDISSNDRLVKTAKPGVLYQGAIACGGGTLLLEKM